MTACTFLLMNCIVRLIIMFELILTFSVSLCTNRMINGINRLMLVTSSCGTNLIAGQLWHESYYWLAVARTLLLVFCGASLIGQPASQQPGSQPACQPPSHPAASSQPYSNFSVAWLSREHICNFKFDTAHQILSQGNTGTFNFP